MHSLIEVYAASKIDNSATRAARRIKARAAAASITHLETYKGFDIERNAAGVVIASRACDFPMVCANVNAARARIDSRVDGTEYANAHAGNVFTPAHNVTV